MKSGLPNNTVNSIAQDIYGYIWIGTYNGLSRRGGEGYTNYYVTGDSNALSSNIIYQIMPDSTGKLWILDANGLCYYSYIDNHFHYLEIHKNVKQPLSSMVMDKKQTIWFTSTMGLFKIDTRSLQYSLVNQDREVAGGSLWIDEMQRIWISNKNRIFLYNVDGNSITEMHGLPMSGIGYITGFFSQRENEIWMAYKNVDSPGIKLYDKTAMQTQTFVGNDKQDFHEHYSDFILHPFLTGDTVLWCNKEKVLALFNLKTKKFVPNTYNQRP
ncbi:MAG: two-component regulator propeller domain-containing protein, partial [Ferruginibacter sp.]